MDTIDDLQAALQYHCSNPQRGNCDACGLRRDCQTDLDDLLQRLRTTVGQLQSAGASGVTGAAALQQLAGELVLVTADSGSLRPFQTTADTLIALAAYANALR